MQSTPTDAERECARLLAQIQTLPVRGDQRRADQLMLDVEAAFNAREAELVQRLWRDVGQFVVGAGFPTLWRALYVHHVGTTPERSPLGPSASYQPNNE